MKKKFSILLILVVAVLTLAVVGYAGWYITRDPQQETGNVTAYSVNNDEIDVALCKADGTAATADVDDTITFGYKSATPTYNWLRYEADVQAEDLEVYVKITAPRAGTFTIAATNYNSGLFGTPDIAEPATPVRTGTVSLSGSTITFGTSGSIVIKVTYKWGLPSNQNPYEYFNSFARSATLDATQASLATTTMGLSGCTEGASITVFANAYLSAVNTAQTTDFIITVTE